MQTDFDLSVLNCTQSDTFGGNSALKDERKALGIDLGSDPLQTNDKGEKVNCCAPSLNKNRWTGPEVVYIFFAVS